MSEFAFAAASSAAFAVECFAVEELHHRLKTRVRVSKTIAEIDGGAWTISGGFCAVVTGTLVGVASLSAAAATCGDGVLVTETRSTNGIMHERCWIK